MTQDTAPPQILWLDERVSWSANFMIITYGDLLMRNLWVYFGDTAGYQARTPIVFASSGAGSPGHAPQYGTFENCIFDFMPCPSNASGVICVKCEHFNGTFRNCYFRNCVDPVFPYYGRAVSFPYDETGYHADYVLFENCTFANMGYVYQQEGGNYADNVHFNHCTFLNIAMFSLESGWWYKMSVTNSLWVNGFMLGHQPVRYGSPVGGTIRIDSVASFGFSVPFDEQDRRILFAHNSYFIEPWLSEWMANNPASQSWRQQGWEDQIPRPQPMVNQRTLAFLESDDFPYMNAANLYENVDPRMVLPPTDTAATKEFLYQKWCCCGYWMWAWRPELSANYVWPLHENLAYSNDTLLSAGIGGFPLGDLFHWFPEEYRRWKAQADEEWAGIVSWLETGSEPAGAYRLEYPSNWVMPAEFALEQNYPNPCNRMTVIRYRLRRPCHVRLVVFDLLGREVATLLVGSQGGGEHMVTFDCSRLPEGIYLYQLQVGEVVKTRKLLLLQ